MAARSGGKVRHTVKRFMRFCTHSVDKIVSKAPAFMLGH